MGLALYHFYPWAAWGCGAFFTGLYVVLTGVCATMANVVYIRRMLRKRLDPHEKKYKPQKYMWIGSGLVFGAY